jgi:hypothetical protein
MLAAMNTMVLPRRTRLMFPGVALLILAIVGIGYGPRIFVVGLYHPEMQHWIIRIHVMLVSLWLCTFALQAALAATGRLDWHRRIGPWGFRIGAVWIVSALLALAVLLHLDPTTGAESFILLTRIGLFAVCLGMAYRERTAPAEHKRWMLLGMSQAIIGGIMRLPGPGLTENFPRSALIALLIPAAFVLYDLSTLKRLTRATLWGRRRNRCSPLGTDTDQPNLGLACGCALDWLSRDLVAPRAALLSTPIQRSRQEIPCDNKGNRDDSCFLRSCSRAGYRHPAAPGATQHYRRGVRPHPGGPGARSFSHRTWHLQRDVERALLL